MVLVHTRVPYFRSFLEKSYTAGIKLVCQSCHIAYTLCESCRSEISYCWQEQEADCLVHFYDAHKPMLYPKAPTKTRSAITGFYKWLQAVSLDSSWRAKDLSSNGWDGHVGDEPHMH